jgi:aminopeptidase-like protein
MRKPFAEFPEYHTSKDNKSSLSFERLAENVQFLATLVDVLDANVFYRSTNPNCEPQLGKRDLYRNLSKEHTLPNQVEAMFWLLNYSDGYHDLLDIAERSALPVSTFLPTIATLLESGLIERCPPHDVS